MAHTITEYTFNGTQTDYDLSFSGGFRVRADVTAYKEGANRVPISFSWLTDTRVRINTNGLVAGDTIAFVRTVSKIASPVNMLNPNNFTREAVTTTVTHTLQALQEVLDGRIDSLNGAVIDQLDEYVDEVNRRVIDAGNARNAAQLAAANANQHRRDAQTAAEAVQTMANVPSYATTAQITANFPQMPDGTLFGYNGTRYFVDRRLIGVNSALHQEGVNWVRRENGLDNMFLGTFFTSQDDNTVNFCTSVDGVHFKTINSAALPLAGSATGVSQRDPSITFYRGWWLMFGTGAAPNSHDFVMYKSRDLITWSKQQCTLGGGPYFGTQIMPGGVNIASSIWAPEAYIENGTLYLHIAIRYGANVTDAYGNSINHMKTYRTELFDLDTKLWSVPQAVTLPNMASTSWIDMSVCKRGPNSYVAAVKNDANKTVSVCTATTLNGPWAVQHVISSSTMSLEGPCICPVYVKNENSDGFTKKWRVYLDNNRTGAGDEEPNILVGAPYYVESANENPGGTWGELQRPKFDKSVRHGSVINLADFPDLAARTATTASAIGGTKILDFTDITILNPGTQTIRPQQDRVYAVNDTTQATLNFRQGPADRFYLAVMTGQVSAGITVLFGPRIQRSFIIGYGKNHDTLIEMRRYNGGSYYPVGFVERSKLAVTKTGTEQTFPASEDTVVSFPQVTTLANGTWSANRFTPQRGMLDLQARVTITGAESGQNNFLSIRKNGALLATAFFHGIGGNATGQVILNSEPCNGTDYFEVVVRSGGTGTKTVVGDAHTNDFRATSY